MDHSPILDIELKRQELQARLDSGKTMAERNRLGQFSTPLELAKEIMAYAVKLIPKDTKVKFIDPAIGTGVFFSALIKVFPLERISIAEGYEIDEYYGEPSRKLWANTLLKIHIGDFTEADAPPAYNDKFNLLVCNPPYVRHHHIKSKNKQRLQEFAELACGVRIHGLAGLYCYFLCLAHRWITEGGIAVWLIPSEFMDVNYGKAIKQYLLTKVKLLRVHRFDPQFLQFNDALVSTSIIFLKNEKPSADHRVEFTFGGNLITPQISRYIPVEALQNEIKWTRFPAEGVRGQISGLTLSDLFTIKRGLATGDNHFFILPLEQIQKLNLPQQFFRPILPSPRFLTVNEVQADEFGNPLIDRKVFLLDCSLSEEDIQREYPDLWRYLASGIPKVSSRYLCRNRRPWYAQENRPPAPIVCTYMGRQSNGNGSPFRFIINHSRATAANVYLLLYPKHTLASALKKQPDILGEIAKTLNRIIPVAFIDEGRVYGGGLYKMEPNELGRIPADEIAALFPTQSSVIAYQMKMF
jgi:hypothetical protein